MQTYSTKATAIRGAKRKGLTAYTVEETNGRFVIVPETFVKGPILRRSKFPGAVNASHAIYDANPGLRRKDAVNLAVANGIAYYTARTQYQKWRQAQA